MANEHIKILSVCVLVFGFIAVAVMPLNVHAEETSYKPLASENVCLVEKCTAVQCSWCGVMAHFIDMLWGEFGPTQIAIVEWHTTGFGTDNLATTASQAVNTYYSVSGWPDVHWDGGQEMAGYSSAYSDYTNSVNTSRAIAKVFTISITGDIASGSVNVHIEQQSSTTKTNLKLKYAVMDSDFYVAGGTNPNGIYNDTARAVPTADSITTPIASGGLTFTKTFTVNSGWNVAKLSFVAYLQSDTDKSVQQSCYLGYDGSTTAPEISPLFVIPIGGIFVALFAFVYRKRR